MMRSTRTGRLRRKAQRRTRRVKGGGVWRLPITAAESASGAALAQAWDFKYVSAHGATNDRVFVVPANTYVLFKSVAGSLGAREEAVDVLNFIYKIGTDEAWYTGQARAAAGEGLFASIVYDPAAPADHDRRAFYEPGDIIQDLNLTFANHDKPIFPVGVFQCPVPLTLKESFEEFNEGDRPLVPTTDASLFNRRENLFRDQIFGAQPQTRDSLYAVLRKLGPVVRGQKRLIVVDACRICHGPNNAGRVASVARTRRLSVSARCAGLPVPRPLMGAAALREFAHGRAGRAKPAALVARAKVVYGSLVDEEGEDGEPRDRVGSAIELDRLLTDMRAAGF